MNPNQPPQPPGGNEQNQDTFWICHMPYGPVAMVGSPSPGSNAEPLKKAKHHAGAHHPGWVHGIPQPPSQPKHPLPGSPPGFGMPPPWMLGLPPPPAQPQAPAQQAKTMEEHLKEVDKQNAPVLHPDGMYRPAGSGSLAPLPKSRQDPNNPRSLPSNYCAYRNKGNPVRPVMKWDREK